MCFFPDKGYLIIYHLWFPYILTRITLQDLTDALWYYKEQGNENYLRQIIRPVERAVDHLPKIWVLDTTVDALCHGANLNVPGIAKVETDIQVDEQVAVLTLKDELVCYGTVKMISKDLVKEKKGVAGDGCAY